MNILKRILQASLRVKILLAVLIILLAWFGYSKLFATKASAITYTTQAAERKTLITTTSVTGNISTAGMISVNSPTNGEIEEIYVKNGDTVKPGANLFKVKSTATADQIASAYASYLNAQNTLKNAQLNKTTNDSAMWKARDTYLKAEDNYNYMINNSTNRDTNKTYTDLEKQLINSAYVQAQKDWQTAQEKYNQSDVSITAAQAQLSSAYSDYLATQTKVVTSTAEGQIANLSAKVGDYVTAGNTSATYSSTSSTGSSTPILYIGNYSNLVIKATVNEVDLPKIHVGQKATITMDAFSDKTFAGEITHIDTIGANSSGVVSYNVYISFLAVPENVAPGMSVAASIQIARKDDVIVVPSSAVTTANSQSTVQIMKADKSIETRTVQTGISNDTETEITSGIQEGENVVTSTSSNTTTTKTSGTTNSVFGGFGGRTGGGQIRIAR